MAVVTVVVMVAALVLFVLLVLIMLRVPLVLLVLLAMLMLRVLNKDDDSVNGKAPPALAMMPLSLLDSRPSPAGGNAVRGGLVV